MDGKVDGKVMIVVYILAICIMIVIIIIAIIHCDICLHDLQQVEHQVLFRDGEYGKH